MFLPHPLVKFSIVECLRDREVAFSATDFQGLNFESRVWRAVSSHSSHHHQKVLLACIRALMWQKARFISFFNLFRITDQGQSALRLTQNLGQSQTHWLCCYLRTNLDLSRLLKQAFDFVWSIASRADVEPGSIASTFAYRDGIITP